MPRPLTDWPDEDFQRWVGNLMAEFMSGSSRAPAAGALLQRDAYPELNRRYGSSASFGLLRAVGYRVGKLDGEEEERRRRILRFVLCSELPVIREAEYMARWGEPGSGRRRGRIAYEIELYIANRGGDPRMNKALSAWKSDLAWLQQEARCPS